MFGAFAPGQGYFGQGPMFGTPPFIAPVVAAVIDLVATAGLPVQCFAAALMALEFAASFDTDLDMDTTVG